MNNIKYNLDDLLSGDDLLIATDNYKNKENVKLIDNIVLTYLSHNKLNQNLIEKIKYDDTFKAILLENIENRIKKIEDKNDLIDFKEVSIILSLLSFGENFSLFERSNEDNIKKLFLFYGNLFKNKETFKLNFKFYLCVLNTFSLLFEINQNINERKKSVSYIIEIIIESINNIKMSGVLKQKDLELLNIYQGKLLLKYSNLVYIYSFSQNDLLSEFTFILNKQIDGYFLISAFSENEQDYKTYLETITRTMFLLLMKLLKCNDYSFNSLKNIIHIYTKEINHKSTNINSIEDLKKELFSNLLSLYCEEKSLDNAQVLKKMIKDNQFNSKNLRILHDIVLFDDTLKTEDICTLFDFLIHQKSLKNKKNELLKLKILDVLIYKFVKNHDLLLVLPLIKEFSILLKQEIMPEYKNFFFSKLYLSISYFYSFLDKKYLSSSYEYYYLSEKISVYSFVKIFNKDIYKTILINNAKNHFLLINISCTYDDNKLLLVGENLMKDYFIQEEINEKFPLKNRNSLFLEKLIKKTDLENSFFQETFSNLLKRHLFFDCLEIKIMKKDEISETYDILDGSLFDLYKIVYKNDNKFLYGEENKIYIIKLIKSFLLSFLLKIKEPKNYNNFLQIEEYISL